MTELLPFLPGFLVAASILFVGASSPGPAVAMLMGLSLNQGRHAALVACAGIAIGSATINLMTLVGVGLVLQQTAWAVMALKLLGAGYLGWLAVGAFRKAVHPPQMRAVAVARQPVTTLFAQGYLLQVTNPKAIAFWLAISAVGATQDAPAWTVAVFVALMSLLSFACHAAWALALSAGPVLVLYQRIRRWVEAALGVFFAFAAVKLANTRM